MGQLEELATALIEREGRGDTPFGFYIVRSGFRGVGRNPVRLLVDIG